MIEDKLKYLIMRCYKCGRLITCFEILHAWSQPPPPAGCGDHAPICPCGSRHVNPSNPKLWEELFLPRVWKVWLFKVVLPWFKKR